MSEGSVAERAGACVLFPDWPLEVATTAISNAIEISMRIFQPPKFAVAYHYMFELSRMLKAAMKTLAPVLCSILAGLLVPVDGLGQTPGNSKPLIAIFIVDGLRPDSINTLDTPTI